MANVVKSSIQLSALAAQESEAFTGTGFCEPERIAYWGKFEAHMKEKATRVVNGLMNSMIKAYMKQAMPFLVANLIAEFYASTKIEFDERGPYIRLEAKEASPCPPPAP